MIYFFWFADCDIVSNKMIKIAFQNIAVNQRIDFIGTAPLSKSFKILLLVLFLLFFYFFNI